MNIPKPVAILAALALADGLLTALGIALADGLLTSFGLAPLGAQSEGNPLLSYLYGFGLWVGETFRIAAWLGVLGYLWYVHTLARYVESRWLRLVETAAIAMMAVLVSVNGVQVMVVALLLLGGPVW